MEESTEFKPLKILIAEDDKHLSLIYRIGLVDEIFEKFFVKNGDEVISTYRECKPDILILDIMLPGMSGYAVLKEVREQVGDQETPIIMASSLSGKDAVLDCIRLGIQGYLVKPFSHKDVAMKVLGYYRKTNHERAVAALARLEAIMEVAEQSGPRESETTG